MPINGPEQFHANYIINPTNKCWEWQPKRFKFKVDRIIHDPRRYAVQVTGKVIPVGRNLTPSCGNPLCVNPAHARLKHDGSPIPDNQPLYLTIEDFDWPPLHLSRKYCVDKMEIKRARQRTLELIIKIKNSLLPFTQLSSKFNVSVPFIKEIKALTLMKFEDLKYDKNAGLYEFDEFADPAGLLFKLD